MSIPDQEYRAVTIELLDKNRLGKNKSIRVLSFDTSRIASKKVIEQGWYSLSRVTSTLLFCTLLPVIIERYGWSGVAWIQQHL